MSTGPGGLDGLPKFEHRTRRDELLPPPSGINAQALWGFMLSLAGVSLVAIVLAVIALGKISDSGQRGRGLAVAALVLGLCWIPVEIWLLSPRS